MKNLIPALFILLLVSSCKKEEINPGLLKEFTIQSAANGAAYCIKVALPENYDPARKKYATIYVLDGKENFDYVATKCKKLSSNYAVQNVLVVSIGYGYDRSIDYTPTKASQGGGGAEKFMQFIAHELIPEIESTYAADTSRKSKVIIGHSFGGLLGAYAFANFNHVFGNYLLLSPSLWYDNEILLRMEAASRATNSTSEQLVYMGIGGLEGNGRMQAPFEAFYQRLNHYYPAIKITKHIENGLDHVGSKNPNISHALDYYFQNQ
ncbi:MAG TPA: alpha/beta hydrolase-fold protein [Chitinophagales bacterium]|nr:alpha/beta hydrolase-fold protein [Chitinophagales bacterium]